MVPYLLQEVEMNKKLDNLKTKQSDIFEGMSNILSALSAPVRLKLVHFLSQAPLTVEVLSLKIEQSMANTSMHLRKMHCENLVLVETIGQKRLYSLHPSVYEFWEHCQDFVQKIDPSLSLNGEVYGNLNWERTLEETLQLIDKKEVFVLDVRPRDEVDDSHPLLPYNYIHMPAADLPNNLHELPKKKKILVICRGRMCALSSHTVNYLREKHFNAYRLDKSWFALNQALNR